MTNDQTKMTNQRPMTNDRLGVGTWSFIGHSGLVIGHCFLILILSGCNAVGVIANAIPQQKPAAYKGLEGQSVGVMIWADRGSRIDWPSLQLELASLIQQQLQKSDAKELKGTTWPVLPASIVRYQRDHPSVEATPITEVAPKLGITRLIYVELESFSTRSEASLQMYRGNAIATLKVIEVTGSTAKIGYEEAGIRAVFPKKAAPEGVMGGNDAIMYRGALAGISKQIADRFMTHEAEKD